MVITMLFNSHKRIARKKERKYVQLVYLVPVLDI